jgi:hypothetical protein
MCSVLRVRVAFFFSPNFIVSAHRLVKVVVPLLNDPILHGGLENANLFPMSGPEQQQV